MHIKARLLVVSVFDIGTRKTQKLCFLKPRTGGSFALNSQKVDSNFVLAVVSHVDTPVAELSYFWLETHLFFVKLECFSFFKTKKLAVLFPQTEQALSLSCLPCQALAIENSVRNNELWLFFLCSYVFLGVTMWLRVPQRPRMLSL